MGIGGLVTGEARLEPYDRTVAGGGNAVTILGGAPGTIVVLSAYTVPSGNYARVGGGYAAVMRATAPTTPGIYQISVRAGFLNPTLSLEICQAFGGNSVADAVAVMMPCPTGLLLKPGDVVNIIRNDTSVGGTVNYWAVVVANAFTI